MTLTWDGIALGVAVGALTGCLALLALRWSDGKGHQVFMTAFMGGMLVRLLLIAAASAYVLSFTDTHAASYIVAMLGTYLLFLGLEVYYALAKNAQRKQSGAEAATNAD